MPEKKLSLGLSINVREVERDGYPIDGEGRGTRYVNVIAQVVGASWGFAVNEPNREKLKYAREFVCDRASHEVTAAVVRELAEIRADMVGLFSILPTTESPLDFGGILRQQLIQRITVLAEAIAKIPIEQA